MKRCPECNRTFEDTLTYCLVDGSILSAPFDPYATLTIPESRETEPAPTVVLLPEESIREIPPTVASPQIAQKPEELVSTMAAPAPVVKSRQLISAKQPARKSNELAWFIIVFGSIFILFFIFWILTKRSTNTKSSPEKIDVNVQAPGK